MSSSAQAQLAASQTATAAQAEANKNALAFAKDVYAEEQRTRNPYLQGGAAGMSELLLLLGLQPTAGYGGSRTGSGTSGSGGGTSGSGGAPRFVVGPDGVLHEQTLGTNTYQGWLQQEKDLGRYNPSDPAPVPPPTGTIQTGTAPAGQPTAGYSGSDQTYTMPSSVTMQAPDGSTRLVPSNLAPYFQAAGARIIG